MTFSSAFGDDVEYSVFNRYGADIFYHSYEEAMNHEEEEEEEEEEEGQEDEKEEQEQEEEDANEGVIEIVGVDIDISEDHMSSLKERITVYEDEATNLCSVCLTNEKEYVLVSCGHYHTCGECIRQIDSCPICRSKARLAVSKKSLE
jgi:hypothetical protein